RGRSVIGRLRRFHPERGPASRDGYAAGDADYTAGRGRDAPFGWLGDSPAGPAGFRAGGTLLGRRDPAGRARAGG
ncbi:MAG: hypothetical protein ACE5HU_09545, partial [Acidobacteriota bacterium]